MYKIILIFSTLLYPRLITGQWMPYLSPAQDVQQYAQPYGEQMILQSKPDTTSNAKIPIIVLLKPRRAKSLTSDTNSESTALDHKHSEQSIDYNEWLGMPELDGSAHTRPKTNTNEQTISLTNGYKTRQSASDQTQAASAGNEVAIRGRASEQVKWPSFGDNKESISPETMASISHLLPKFAALSQSTQTELGQLAQKSGNTNFEDALKKFASNLTDLEHRNSGNNDNNDNVGSDDKEDETAEDMSNENRNSGLKSSAAELELSDINNNSDDKSQSFGEQRTDNNNRIFNKNHQSLGPEKSTPFINDRNRLKIPVRLETDRESGTTGTQTQTQTGFQPIQGMANKGWQPIKQNFKFNSKPKPKPKPKPILQKPKKITHFYPDVIDGNSMYANSGKGAFGIPEHFGMLSEEHEIFRQPHYPHNFIPGFNARHTVKHLPFHKYSSYVTEYAPTIANLMEMNSDANKPQHIEPAKEGLMAGQEVKPEDMNKDKVEMTDVKNEMGEKTAIIDEKQAMNGLGGDDLSGHQLTCCDILNGHHSGPQDGEVIHEEVIKTEFDDDKHIENGLNGMTGHKHHYQPELAHRVHHHFPHHSKLKCHETYDSSPHQFLWPQPVYKRPVYRPKLFYKPLFFG